MKASNFTSVYAGINNDILINGQKLSSRNGPVSEILANQLTITEPAEMCTGGHSRGMNIFFLLAEALWIWGGRKDVKYLSFFNPNMATFSDDGKSFAAPYGFRLRHWGKYSFEDESNFTEIHMLNDGEDQIAAILKMLKEDPDTRRAVAAIWNPDFDLGVKSLDLPCNDLLFFKVRQNKLHITVCNRSNDLHWGLPTNVFQFAFILRSMAKILGVELGYQNHLSDSLHIYTERDEAINMDEKFNMFGNMDIYKYCKPASFGEQQMNLNDFDWVINSILINTEAAIKNHSHAKKVTDIPFLNIAHQMLLIYITYKAEKEIDVYNARVTAIQALLKIEGIGGTDLLLMGLNFFIRPMSIAQSDLALLALHMANKEADQKLIHKDILPHLGTL